MFFVIKFIITVVLTTVLIADLAASAESTGCSFTFSSFSGPRERYIVFLDSNSITKHYQWLENCLKRSTQKLGIAEFSTAAVDNDMIVDFSVEGKAHGYTAWFDAKFVQEHLSNREEAVIIEKDIPIGINAAVSIQKNPTINLDRIDQTDFPLDQRYIFPKSAGAGVTVYVLDTGVLVNHKEFEGRATFGGAFCSGCPNTDDNGHGSHVSGIVAGKTYGVAKKANIIGVKVLNATGNGTSADMINGLMFVLNDHKKKKNNAVVNMSLGGPFSKAINAAVKSLTNDGIHVITAAGNNANDACKVSPASEPSAITVGAIDDIFDDITDFTNSGKCVDIFAPGREILSVGIRDDRDILIFSGTSQAAPHVSGAVALIISENGNSSPANITQTLLNSATKNILGNLPNDENREWPHYFALEFHDM
ncbi:6051_t:CDS:2 [Acaulospora morrowiae]|uniref:6051_t:CDS:1 n=1 Tax=Acaulospora morrowiae TaxID=94023 RepID=A0A9N9G655_9GLOM|nr:6051_t:CDS:2 [Acaulospora morrowiae]